ncbi:MAG TPA: SBBP repeat-containing protein [Candidatus Binataceae bacterium]|nr:SBBP repeat-containing protein [Candidatus Binataceae bacterium]
MKIARAAAIAAFLLGIIAAAPIDAVSAGPGGEAIFVANLVDVTAYPIGSSGDVPPIAVTTDMIAPSGIARDASGRIYVTNSATNTITIYAANASGNVAPVAVIGGSSTRLANPTGIALDTRGKIYVANGANNSIVIYPPLDAGTGILNEAPAAIIAGSNTQLDGPSAIALDSRGDIYVADEFGGPVVPDTDDSGEITVYPAGSNGNVAPITIIRGVATGLAYPVGIARGPGGEIYIVNLFTANNERLRDYAATTITVYSASSSGNSPPVAIIAGDKTGLTEAQGIALDSSGNLYVTGNSGVGFDISIFSAGRSGNVAPSTIIVGANTGLNLPSGVVLDSEGNLYVSNYSGWPHQFGSVTVYPAGSSGDAKPITTIASSFTGLNGASGIAVDSTGDIYVANEAGGGSITIYLPGSYATVAPLATIAGPNTGLNNPQGIAVDSGGDMFVLNNNDAVTVYPAGSSGDALPNATININSSGENSRAVMAVNPSGDLYVASQGGESCNRRSCSQTSPDNVAIYPAGSNGDAAPEAVIGGPLTRLESPSAIAVNHTGEIYVANQGPMKCFHACGACIPIPDGKGSITAYGPGSNGDVMPITTITGTNTGLRFPYKIALDSEGKIYVLNTARLGFSISCIETVPGNDGKSGTKRADTSLATAGFERTGDPILIFAAGSHGDVAPIGAISGPFTGLSAFGSLGIAVGPAGP